MDMRRRFAAVVVSGILLFAFTSCDVEEVVPKSDEDILLEEYEPYIRAYLTEKYGDGLSKDAEIEVENLDECIFEVHTPVLQYSTFEVRPEPDGTGVPVVPESAEECVFTDDLLQTFWLNQDFRADFMQYVHDDLGLPEDVLIYNLVLDSFDFDGYVAGSDYTDRFATTEYHVIIASWVLDEFDESESKDYMEEFYTEYWPLFADRLSENGTMQLYIEVGGDVGYEAAIYTDDDSWGGPDVNLYAYRGTGLELVDSYYFAE